MNAVAPTRPFDSAAAKVIVDLALLRLAAIEAFERASERLLRAFADEVLGRELVLQPCDVEAIGRRILAAFESEEPVALMTAYGKEKIPGGVPVYADPALAPGDVLVRVRDGIIDARFAVRASGAVALSLESS